MCPCTSVNTVVEGDCSSGSAFVRTALQGWSCGAIGSWETQVAVGSPVRLREVGSGAEEQFCGFYSGER